MRREEVDVEGIVLIEQQISGIKGLDGIDLEIGIRVYLQYLCMRWRGWQPCLTLW